MTEAEATHEPNSMRTVLVAAGVNLAIAVAKAAAGAVTGSAAMWAEAAHSVADTGNQLLLLVGLRRSDRPPDATHPFGYGQERYFWAFIAALGIFLVGGTLSIGEGIRTLLAPQPLGSVWIGLAVLAVAAALEAYSWRTARRQLKLDAQARQRSMVQHMRRASDPSATTVYLEDSAALIGLALAAAALILHALTGWSGWDAIGSIGVGLLLVVVAYLLARRTKALLLEESAPPDIVRPLHEMVAGTPWIAEVRDLQAVFVGPSQLLVNLRVTPNAQTATEPALDLVRRVAELRAKLLQTHPIVAANVTIEEPGGPDTADYAALTPDGPPQGPQPPRT